MKILAVTTLALASMATLALSQESRNADRELLLAAYPRTLSRDGGVWDVSSDEVSHPFSLSPEAPLGENEPSFSELVFGEHLGAGAELMLGTRTSLDLDVRYLFLNPSNDQVIHREFNYRQLTAGRSFFF